MARTESAIAKRAQAHRKYKTHDGRAVPSVTTVLGILGKPYLIKWANELGLEGIDSQEYLNEAAKAGTLAHAMIQENLGGAPWDRSAYAPEQVEIATVAFNNFLAWKKQTAPKMRTIHIEHTLVSDVDGYGGTIDWYGVIGGEHWLIDFKTSKAIYPEHIFQVGAYANLMVENGLYIDGVRILRVSREGYGYEDRVLGFDEFTRAGGVFINALYLFNSIKRFEKGGK